MVIREGADPACRPFASGLDQARVLLPAEQDRGRKDSKCALITDGRKKATSADPFSGSTGGPGRHETRARPRACVDARTRLQAQPSRGKPTQLHPPETSLPP